MKKLLNVFMALATISLFSLVPIMTQSVPTASAENTHYVESGTITIDGSMSDWEDIDPLISDNSDVTGATYYWDNAAADWTTTDPGYSTFTTNPDKMMDLIEMKMVHDDDYIYMMQEKGWDLFTFQVPAGYPTPPGLDSIGEADPPQESYMMPYNAGFPAPADFNHDQVISFDKEGDGEYDYYLVLNFVWSEGDYWANMPTEPSPDIYPPFSVNGYLYGDDGNGTYDNRGTETLMYSFDATEASVMPEMNEPGASLSDKGSREEIRQDRSVVFDRMGINWNESVKVRYDSHSTTLDVSSAADYTFDAGTTPSIITGAGPGGGPHVRSFTTMISEPEDQPNKLMAYADTYRGGVRVATGDIDADGIDEIITGTGEDGGPHLRVFEKDGTQRGIEFFPFHPDFRGGMDVASGDFDGDGKDDIAVSQFSSGESWVKVYKYNSAKTVLFERNIFYNPWGETPECGATVAMGDIDTDGDQEIIVGAGQGCDTKVNIYDYDSSSVQGEEKMVDFNAFPDTTDYTSPYKPGVDVAAGDVDGDGKDEFAVSMLYDEALVRVFRISGVQLSSYYPFGDHNKYFGGMNIDMHDIDADGRAEIITGARGGYLAYDGNRYGSSAPHVIASEYGGESILTTSFYAYDQAFRGGVDMAVGDF